VEASVGLAPPPGPRTSSYGISPEERQAFFGDLIATISRVLPPLQQNGRNDPVAMLGRSLANRTNQKKMQKAEKDITKGKKNKNLDALEGGLKWVSLTKLNLLQFEFSIAYNRGSLLLDQPLQRCWRTGGTQHTTRRRYMPDQVDRLGTADNKIRPNGLVPKLPHMFPGGGLRHVCLFGYFCYAHVRSDRDQPTW
jgi:hypothetical protein